MLFLTNRAKWIMWGLLIGLFLISRSTVAEEPVADRALEKRLVRSTTYTVKSGASFEQLGRLLYGHSTWGQKIKDQNPNLAKYDLTDTLPPGTVVKYKAPKVGKNYTVQKNDWLIRIAVWKYGSTNYWQKILKENNSRIQNPNMIRPGDRLAMGPNGEVTNQSTGTVLMKAIGLSKKAKQQAKQRQKAQRKLASSKPGKPFYIEYQKFLYGFGIGAILLLMTPLWWWIQSMRRVGVAAVEVKPEVALKPKKQWKWPWKRKKRLGYPHSFETPPVEIKQADVSQIRRESGDVDARPSYHFLNNLINRKYFKFLGKK